MSTNSQKELKRPACGGGLHFASPTWCGDGPLLPQERSLFVCPGAKWLSCWGRTILWIFHLRLRTGRMLSHQVLTKEQTQRLHLSSFPLLACIAQGTTPKRVTLWGHSYLLGIGNHPQNLTPIHFLAPTSLHISICTASSSHCHSKSLQ